MAIRNQSVNLGATEGHGLMKARARKHFQESAILIAGWGHRHCPRGCFLNGCAGRGGSSGKRGHVVTGHSHNVCSVSRPGPVRVQAVESRPRHHETSMSPFLPGPNRVGRPPGGEIYHLPPLKGYIDHYLTSCTGGCAHTDTHLYRYTYTHTDMCTH